MSEKVYLNLKLLRTVKRFPSSLGRVTFTAGKGCEPCSADGSASLTWCWSSVSSVRTQSCLLQVAESSATDPGEGRSQLCFGSRRDSIDARCSGFLCTLKKKKDWIERCCRCSKNESLSFVENNGGVEYYVGIVGIGSAFCLAHKSFFFL